MSNHLSQDQIINCAAGRARRLEIDHVGECSECAAELERFNETLVMFRDAIRHRIDNRLVMHKPAITSSRSVAPRLWVPRWAMVAAAIVALVVPYFMPDNKPLQEMSKPPLVERSPEAVMQRVNFHLSGMVSTPMEPVMALIPSEKYIKKTGEVQ